MELNFLIEQAKEAREKAYVPYSKFAVGAVVVTKNGSVFPGCNIENASYGLCNCAERTAIFKAVSEGHEAFETIVITADTEGPCAPCGACRQVISEFFEPHARVVLTNLKGDILTQTVNEILPYSFSKNDMEA